MRRWSGRGSGTCSGSDRSRPRRSEFYRALSRTLLARMMSAAPASSKERRRGAFHESYTLLLQRRSAYDAPTREPGLGQVSFDERTYRRPERQIEIMTQRLFTNAIR